MFWIEMYFLALLTIVDASASQMCTFSNLSTNGQVVKAKIFRSLCCFYFWCCCGGPANGQVEKTKIFRSYVFMFHFYALSVYSIVILFLIPLLMMDFAVMIET